LRQAR